MSATMTGMREGDLDRCQAMLRAGSRSFYAASRVLPRRVRDPATALYAFCRSVDDVVDEEDGPARAIDGLRDRVERAYAGKPRDAACDRAFAWVVERFEIPRVLPDALIEGMSWDAEGRSYETIEETCAYAARVASTVGVMMTCVMGPRGRDVIARACDLGVAMQLTNIARDVGEDAARGRVYLPAAWMREAGIDVEPWRAKPEPSNAVAIVTARLLGMADDLYRRADAGIAMLPRDCRIAIRAARFIYSDIGREIARAGYDSMTRRAVVSTPRKLWLLVRALAGSRTPAAQLAEAPLVSTRFLVDAAGMA